MFQHHPDNYIIINQNRIPLDEFLNDEPEYELPNGAVGRVYRPGIDHYLILPNGDAKPLPIIWPEGDQYIAQVETYQQNQSKRAEAKLWQERLNLPPGATKADFEAARDAWLERENREAAKREAIRLRQETARENLTDVESAIDLLEQETDNAAGVDGLKLVVKSTLSLVRELSVLQQE